ncbi:MAG: acyltransferase [Marinilabiliaceae bacterium]|nr:acyltransferase [Marinilabiliaceae bacterium]
MAYLESKPRYEILDGLRGVAAMMVVAFHLFETYSGGPLSQIINHGYLAVDFFFVLSGFVVGYAYDDRWGKMTTIDFFKRRLVRLHPMLIAGGLFGVLMFYFGDCPTFPLINQTSVGMLLLMFLIASLMIPMPESMDIRGWGENYPINGPQWSLFLEYCANIIYAFILRRLPNIVIALLVLVSAVFTLDLGLGWNLLGDMPENIYSAGTFIGGWGVVGWQLHIAIVRLSFPFLVGLLISRTKRFVTLKGGFWWCALMIVIVLAIPRIGGANPDDFWMNGLYESLSILLLFPLLVAIGAGSRMTDARSQRICKFFGDISYPIYITHYPLIYMQMSWVASHEGASPMQHIFVSVALFFLAIGLSYGLLKLYDEPVREWLKNNFLKKR